VKIADFGIARAVEETLVTQVGTVLGTLRYLAPEQAAGEQVGPAADVYSLGIVLSELCPDAPRALLARMRDPDASRRPSAADVADELGPSGTRYRSSVPGTRVAMLAVALALILAGVAAAAWPRHTAQKVEPVPHAASLAQQARNLEAWLRRYSR
jgi:serine/threonine protein kinase